MSAPPAVEAERKAEDAAARRAAQRQFDHPLVLEAGAGTGKTTTLVARVLAWCLGGGWERNAETLAEPTADRVAARLLGRVAAITFTEAAAAEMATRVSAELARLAAGQRPPPWLSAEALPEAAVLKDRASALLATLDHLVVQTFHAFCRGLLADHPLEAGIHPDLEVDADGSILDEVVRETVEAALPEAYGEPGIDAYLELASKGFGPSRILDAVLALATAGVPAEGLAEDPFGDAPVTAFVADLRSVIEQPLALLDDAFAGETSGQLKKAKEVHQALGLVAHQLWSFEETTERPSGAFDLLLEFLRQALPDGIVNRLKDWGRDRFTGAEKGLFEGRRAEVRYASAELRGRLAYLGTFDPPLLQAACEALGPLLRRVEAEMRRRGVMTFQDLLVHAGRLLADRPGLAARRRRAIDQLLVDEFQDTDPLQCEIVGRLALEGPAEERPGLFLVGDPKQSIYGWRSADLAAYDDFVERVEAAGGERRRLIENFRSVPAILEEVTRSIEPVMHEKRGLQPPYEALLPCAAKVASAGFRGGGRRPVEFWVSWTREDTTPTTQEATEAEAEAVADDILALHRRENVEWKDIAILLRSTGDLDLYLEALRRRRVPFAVGRDKQYYRRREIIEAAALVRTILDPGDHLALLTVLRSALVGVPDAALIPLWRRELPRRMMELTEAEPAALEEIEGVIAGAVEATPRDIPGIERIAGWEHGLRVFVHALARARESFEADPADVFVETVRGLFLMEETEAARYLGPYRLANLERFFLRLLSTLEEGGGNATALLRMLRTSISEAIEAEEAKPEDGLEDAVQVMTIHTAKGLDFEHVYVVQLHKQSGGGGFGPVTEAARTPAGRWEMRLLGAPSLGWHRVIERQEAVERAERIRTLYVAMTRAEQRLVLAGLWPEQPTECPPDKVASHLDLLTGRTTPLADGAITGDTAGEPVDDATGARWRVPARAAAKDLSTSDEPREDDDAGFLPSATALATMAEHLRRRSAAAEARMDRGFSGAASSEAHEHLREIFVEARLANPAGAAAAVGARGVALEAGDQVHRILERLDLKGDLNQQIARALEDIESPAAERTASLLNGFAAGALGTRLRELAPHIVGRELPVLLAPQDVDTGPTAFVSGAADLVYRDPRDGRLVVVDYKTDQLLPGDDEGLARRTQAYALQAEVYRRALAEALPEETPPKVELWFLALDHIVEVEAALAAEPASAGAPSILAEPPPLRESPQAPVEPKQQSLFPDWEDS